MGRSFRGCKRGSDQRWKDERPRSAIRRRAQGIGRRDQGPTMAGLSLSPRSLSSIPRSLTCFRERRLTGDGTILVELVPVQRAAEDVASPIFVDIAGKLRPVVGDVASVRRE